MKVTSERRAPLMLGLQSVKCKGVHDLDRQRDDEQRVGLESVEYLL